MTVARLERRHVIGRDLYVSFLDLPPIDTLLTDVSREFHRF